MKKFVSVFLAAAMVCVLLAGCGSQGNAETTLPAEAASVEGSLEQLLNKIVEENPVEFAGESMTIDLTDTSEEGLWALNSYTGLEDAAQITEAAVFEPMMGSIAFSMVAVRIAPEAEGETVAQSMKSGINPRKWVCVEADDLLVAGYADVVLLVMVNRDNGVTAQSFVDAFGTVVGGTPAFVL